MLNILLSFIYLFINSFNPLKVSTLIFLIFLIPGVKCLYKLSPLYFSSKQISSLKFKLLFWLSYVTFHFIIYESHLFLGELYQFKPN